MSNELIRIKTPMADAYKINRPDIYYAFLNERLHKVFYEGSLKYDFKLAKNLALLNTGKNIHNKEWSFIQQIHNKDDNFTFYEIGVILTCMQSHGYELYKQIENMDEENYGVQCIKLDKLGELFDIEYQRAHQDFEVHLKLSGGAKVIGLS
jgi:hypothetical protein